MKRIFKCCRCEKELPLRKLKKLSDGLYCSDCQKQKRKENRERLKETLVQDGLMRRRTKSNLPRIIPSREKQKQLNTKRIKKKLRNLYIDGEEKKTLYIILRNKGFTPDQSNKRIKDLCSQMEIVKEKLKDTNIEEDVNQRFLEEYNKLIEEVTI